MPKIRRFDQYRTVTIQCWPAQGHLPSEVIAAAMPKLKALEIELPAGFALGFAASRKRSKWIWSFCNGVRHLRLCDLSGAAHAV